MADMTAEAIEKAIKQVNRCYRGCGVLNSDNKDFIDTVISALQEKLQRLENKVLTNFDRIKNMSVEEMAAFIEGIVAVALGDNSFVNQARRIEWLNQPVEIEGK